MGEAGRPQKRASDRFIGRSKAVSDLLSLVLRVAKSESTVLITGESGTGKERIARLLHDGSPRASHPFVPVNCGAIPEGLMESELFGHEKGAFTGAVSGRTGRFEIAEGGTLFFDEIGELPLSLQVKLLRVLQEKVYERVGGSKARPSNVRILAATHRNLEEMVREGGFREDLFYRLAVIPVEIPPLRSRPEDIALLVGFFIRRWEEEGRGAPVRLTPRALAAMEAYGWPGNVRELENVMERLLVLNGGETLDVEGLPEKVLAASRTHGNVLPAAPAALPGPAPSLLLPSTPDSAEEPFWDDFELGAFLQDVERTLLVRALSRSGGNRSRAAVLLGINRTTLIEKIRRFGLS